MAVADERKWRGKSAELRYRRPKHPAWAPAGSQSNAAMSRRAVLLGTTAAMAITVPARSRQISHTFLSTGPVQALRSMQSKLADSVSIKDYGAIGDGNSHPLSSILTFNAQPTSGWTLDHDRRASARESPGLALLPGGLALLAVRSIIDAVLDAVKRLRLAESPERI
jgi:hypothetical protein